MRRSRRTPLVVTLVVVTVLVALGVGLVASGVVSARRLPWAGAKPTPTPTPSPSPTPTVRPAPDVLAALPSTAPSPSPSALASALRPLLAADALGRSVGAAVLDPASGQLLLDVDAGTGQTPASTTKLLTAAAVLRVLGPAARLTTRAVADGSGRVVLVGGGDPTLTAASPPSAAGPHGESLPGPPSASLVELARDTAAALRSRGTTSVRVAVDDSLFTGPAVSPHWEPQYVPSGVAAPVSALAVDEARRSPGKNERYDDPALAAGSRFASLLAAEGLTVSGDVTRATAPAGAAPLASVVSPPVADLVERMLVTSDDDLSEALLRLVGLKSGEGASFSGGTAAVAKVLTELGVPTQGLRLYDGSGLSRDNLIAPRTLVALLALAGDASHPELRPILTGLPVAGFSGTLSGRPAAGASAGAVRAKTGTLTGVSALAGTVVDADGRLLTFAVLTDEVPSTGTLAARRALDAVATRLARCGCR